MLLCEEVCRRRKFLILHLDSSYFAVCRLNVAVHCRNLILVFAYRHTSIYESFSGNNIAAHLVAVAIHLVSGYAGGCNVRLPCNLHRVETRQLLSLNAHRRHSREHRTAELHDHRLRRNGIVAVRILVVVVEEEAHDVIVYRHGCGASHVVKGFAVGILRRVRIDENMIVGEVHAFFLQILICKGTLSVLVYITQIVVLAHHGAVTADVVEVEVVVVASRKNSALLAGFHIVERPSSAYFACSASLIFSLPTAEVKQLLAVGRELLAYTERRLLVRECGEIAVRSP